MGDSNAVKKGLSMKYSTFLIINSPYEEPTHFFLKEDRYSTGYLQFFRPLPPDGGF